MRCAINKKDKKSNNIIPSLLLNNELFVDPCKIADNLNEYFCSEPQSIANKIPPSDWMDGELDTDLPGQDSPSFRSSDIQVGHEELFKALSELEPKTSTDFNNLSMKFIKQCFNDIVEPLLYIVNLSFSTGCFPSQLKIAKVIPILKSGDPRLPNNYRPISLLSNFSKIFEKIMSNRLLNHMEYHNLFSKSQFGFRKGHSTVHPMVLIDNFISDALNNKKYALAIFCDLRKAFDTVDHQILLKKLVKVGVRGKELDWFKDYLAGRKQFVFVNGKCSSLMDILLGVPQGSILGPLLFLIYINDLPTSTLFYSLLFADDTNLLAKADTLEELFEFANAELAKISLYFNKNHLSLHPEKTNYMVFCNSRNLDLSNFVLKINVHNKIQILTRITESSEIPAAKFLGLYIDPAINYKYHISTIRKKYLVLSTLCGQQEIFSVKNL